MFAVRAEQTFHLTLVLSGMHLEKNLEKEIKVSIDIQGVDPKDVHTDNNGGLTPLHVVGIPIFIVEPEYGGIHEGPLVAGATYTVQIDDARLPNPFIISSVVGPITVDPNVVYKVNGIYRFKLHVNANAQNTSATFTINNGRFFPLINDGGTRIISIG